MDGDLLQLAVFQPASVALLLMCAIAFGVSGSIPRDTLVLFLAGPPALAAGTWAGFLLYGRLDEASFRRVVLLLILLSGAFLLPPLGR